MTETLSEKRVEGKEIVAKTFNGLYPEEDLKQFIKDLKELDQNADETDTHMIIKKEDFDKLAGDKLTK